MTICKKDGDRKKPARAQDAQGIKDLPKLETWEELIVRTAQAAFWGPSDAA